MGRSGSGSSGLAYIGETIKQTMGVNSLVAAQSQISETFKKLTSSLGPAEKLLEEDRKLTERMMEALDPTRGLKDALQSISIVQFPGQTIREMVQHWEANLKWVNHQYTISTKIAELYCITGAESRFGASITVHSTPAAPAKRTSAQSVKSAKKNTSWRPSQDDTESLSQESERVRDLIDQWDQYTRLSRQEASLTINRFIERQDAPVDPRVGLEVTAMWCAHNQHRLHPEEGQKLNLLLQAYLCQRHGKSAPPHVFRALHSGLLIPAQVPEQNEPDLDPTIYTSEQLAKKKHFGTHTLKRMASKALERGPLPQPLPECPGVYVVQASDQKGGRGKGWKFQQLRQAVDTSPIKNSQPSTIRTTQIHPNRHH